MKVVAVVVLSSLVLLAWLPLIVVVQRRTRTLLRSAVPSWAFGFGQPLQNVDKNQYFLYYKGVPSTMKSFCNIVAFCVAAHAAAAAPFKLGGGVHRQVQRVGTAGVFEGEPLPSSVNCTWKYFDNALDHFTPGTTVNGTATYRQRYCIYDGFYNKPSDSQYAGNGVDTPPPPMLFYTGNESPVEEYVNNTGLMWSLGKKMGALLVFAEHRYEGESVPELKGMRDCMAFCTTSQALADFAVLIKFLKQDLVRFRCHTRWCEISASIILSRA